MVKFYSFFILFFGSFGIEAQSINDCSVVYPTFEPMNTIGYNRSINISSNDTPYDESTPYVLNVFFTLVNDDANLNILGNLLDEQVEIENNFLKCIKILNINYNSFNIFFKYNGFKVVKNSVMTNSGTLVWNFAPLGEIAQGPFQANDAVQYREMNNLNLYFVNNIPGNGGASMGNTESVYETGLLLSSLYNRLEFTLVHEIGHCLSLHHVMGQTSLFPLAHPLSAFTTCEHVTRDVNDSGYNADIAGDWVVDTPAQPVVYDFYFENNCGAYNINPILHDCENVPYENVQNKNFMNYASSSVCNGHFTAGQKKRMREFIKNNTTVSWHPIYTFSSLGEIDLCRNSIESLYEPFSIGSIGQNGNNNIITESYSKTATPNITNTGVNIWNCGPFVLRFQPGFNYEFSNVPNTVLVNTEDQYNGISSTYIGVKIPIIGQNIINSNTPVCFYSYEPFTSGNIKSTTNLGIGTFTEKELDQIKASDPNLFEELQSGKYHIITKKTDSNYTNQILIYKN